MTPEEIGELYGRIRKATARHSITRDGIDISLPSDEVVATMTAAAIQAKAVKEASVSLYQVAVALRRGN